MLVGVGVNVNVGVGVGVSVGVGVLVGYAAGGVPFTSTSLKMVLAADEVIGNDGKLTSGTIGEKVVLTLTTTRSPRFTGPVGGQLLANGLVPGPWS